MTGGPTASDKARDELTDDVGDHDDVKSLASGHLASTLHWLMINVFATCDRVAISGTSSTLARAGSSKQALAESGLKLLLSAFRMGLTRRRRSSSIVV